MSVSDVISQSRFVVKRFAALWARDQETLLTVHVGQDMLKQVHPVLEG